MDNQVYNSPSNFNQNPNPNIQSPTTPEYKYPVRHKSVSKIVAIISALVIIAVIGGGLFYAYYMKLGPFAISPYTEKNLLSGIMNASLRIRSSTYSVSASLNMVQRDADAEPFASKLSNQSELNRQYQNDSKRADSAESLLYGLKAYKDIYPADLNSLLNNKNSFRYTKPSITDPVTGSQYSYKTTENGKNFALTVTFETGTAISIIKKSYQFSPEKTIIDGKTVIFTKDSPSYIYVSSEPPKPFFVNLADALSYFPAEGKASVSVTAQTDFNNKDSADWKFNIDAMGDFGDITYKINGDALKKDIYYFKINNLPSLFLNYISIQKGQWVSVDPAKVSTGTNDYYEFSPKAFSDIEESYKKHRQEVADFLKKIVSIADEQGLFGLKNPAQNEKVDGRDLTKYELEIRKDAVVPFYSRVLDEFNNSSIKDYYPLLADKGLLEYFQSPEFGEVFDYYKKNTNLTFWVDSKGFPAIVSYAMRIVPQDSAIQFKDKQANLIFKLELSDINKPVNIEAPRDAKDIKEIIQPYVDKSIDATIKANMSTMLTKATLYYDKNGNYSNWCSDKQYVSAKESIEKAYGVGSNVICKCDTTSCKSSKKWCSSALLKSGSYYCIDSSGTKIENDSPSVCSGGVCNY